VLTSGLQLAVKVSPDQFTYDSNAWLPVVHRVNNDVPAARALGSNTDEKKSGSVADKRDLAAL
jgi:hypothetical protein